MQTSSTIYTLRPNKWFKLRNDSGARAEGAIAEGEVELKPMPALDTHIQAFHDDRTARPSLDRISQAKEHWRAYVQGRAELELMRNKQAILLSAWQAEDRALRSSRTRRVVCVDCGARELEHFYRSKEGGSTLCQWCFQSRVNRGVAREADTHQP